MANEAEQLEREALLMLYASGEMSPALRAELDAKLASDPALGVDLQVLRESLERSEASIGDLDQRQRPPVNAGVAVRRVERAMQQWTVDRLRAPAASGKSPRRMPWWSYPVAAAAIVIVSFLIWSGRQEVRPTEANRDAQNDILVARAEALAERLVTEFAMTDSVLEESDAAYLEEPGTFFMTPGEEASW